VNSKYLAFYELGSDGKLHEVKRSIFPVADEKGYVFELPRTGRTIVVRGEKDRKLHAKYTWDGRKFVKDATRVGN